MIQKNDQTHPKIRLRLPTKILGVSDCFVGSSLKGLREAS